MRTHLKNNKINKTTLHRLLSKKKKKNKDEFLSTRFRPETNKETDSCKKWKEMTEALKLPIIDLISPDRISTANSIRQVLLFFYNNNNKIAHPKNSPLFYNDIVWFYSGSVC